MRRYQQTQHLSKTGIRLLILLSFGLVGYLIAGVLFPVNTTKPSLAQSSHKQVSPKQKKTVDPEAHFVMYEQKVKPIMEYYCYDCHGDGMDKGELDMDQFVSFASMTRDRETWGKINDHLKLKLMPPVDEDQPSAAEVKTVTDWIDNTIFYTDPENPDPGKVVIRRLNRYEYQNTIYDLLGVKVDVESILPLDDTGYGFDTISDVHSVSPAHIEKYLTAAETALAKAVVLGDMPWQVREIKLDQLKHSNHRNRGGRYIVNGAGAVPKAIMSRLTKGIYEIEIEASSSPAGDKDAILDIRTAEKSHATFSIKAGDSHTQGKIKIPLDSQSKLSFGFTNDFYDPEANNSARRDRNLYLHSIKIRGPLDQVRPAKPATHLALFPPRTVAQTPELYAQEVWLKFARRAFRRPVSLSEIKPYSRFIDPEVESDQELQEQILLGLQAMLISPEFLYLQSTPESENSPISSLSEIALASRLSYFLWSSTPDDRLLKLAEAGELKAQLSKEIDRMLDDPKSQRFIANFTGQWLQLRDLEVHSPDSKLFPKWSKKIRQDAVRETELFIQNLVKNNVSVLDCLDSDYSFLNQNLAEFYGVEGVTGDHFRKVNFSPAIRIQRGGLIGQISVLTLTSYPDRTSPVLRGKWLLENVLGTPPPPPPPDIPELQPDEKHAIHQSLRAQLEEHRKKAECAACHKLLDPLGFALENYNGIGKWRSEVAGNAIDTSGQLISGENIKDSAALRSVLRSNKSDQFVRCLTEKLLTYGIGRGVEYYDKPAIDQILNQSKQDNHAFRSLIHAVIRSTPFQMTRTTQFQH